MIARLQQQQQCEDGKAKLYAENKKLEAELATVRRDAEFLEKERAETRADNDVLRAELKRTAETVDTNHVLFMLFIDGLEHRTTR